MEMVAGVSYFVTNRNAEWIKLTTKAEPKIDDKQPKEYAMPHPVQCKCGTLKGEISDTGTCNRVACYCKDCRAFARFLSTTPDILDQQGGTEIIQLAQSRLRFTQGEEQLAAMRLTDKGMIRWYAKCCETPIGNVLANPKLSFIGMIHTCLKQDRMAQDFGTNIATAHVGSALGESKPQQTGMPGVVARMAWIMLSDWISGSYKKSALFDSDGKPRVTPQVLSAAELADLKNLDNTEPNKP